MHWKVGKGIFPNKNATLSKTVLTQFFEKLYILALNRLTTDSVPLFKSWWTTI